MKLCEHPDFDQVIIRTSEHFASEGLRPSIIEKDYYVTEALRIIASTAGPQVIFKGGTSLSKGWDLIKRFSEDIDIFLDPLAFDPPLRPRGIDRELKALRDAVNQHPALAFLPDESQTIGGFGRNDYFSYSQLFGGVGEIANRVLLEAGTASGRQPTTNIDLSSYVARFLQESGWDLDVEDVGSFCMRLLHFRRTFVEKMFAIHSRVELLKRDNQAPGHGCGTTTISSSYRSKRKSLPCSSRRNTHRSRMTTTKSAGLTSPEVTARHRTCPLPTAMPSFLPKR